MHAVHVTFAAAPHFPPSLQPPHFFAPSFIPLLLPPPPSQATTACCFLNYPTYGKKPMRAEPTHPLLACLLLLHSGCAWQRFLKKEVVEEPCTVQEVSGGDGGLPGYSTTSLAQQHTGP